MTLVNASSTGEKIPDHSSGEMVGVIFVGYEGGHWPKFMLVYEDKTERPVEWSTGQAMPKEESSLQLEFVF